MKLIGKIILIVILLLAIPSIMAIGIMLSKELGHVMDGSFQFWFIMITVLVCSTSLVYNFLYLIEKK